MSEQQLIERIRSIREGLGLTQASVAERLGVSRPTLAQMESGVRKISAMEVVRLAEIFQMSCEELLDPKVDKPARAHAGPKSGDRISVPQKNLAKFREVLLYILNEVGSRPNIGETVIYKLLYFIDFDYYEKYEEQLVGATYIKNKFGPTPIEFKKIVDKMIDEGAIERVESKYFTHPQTKYLPRREPNLKLLTAQELETIDEVLGRLAHMNATQISEYSHQDVPWISADDGKPIDYESVFYRTVQYSVRRYDEDDE